MALPADGTIMVPTSPESGGRAGQSGFPKGIALVDPATGNQSMLSSGGNFMLPTYACQGPKNRIFVTDLGQIVPLNGTAVSNAGLIIQVDLATGTQTIIVKGNVNGASGSLVDGPNAITWTDGYLYFANVGTSNNDPTLNTPAIIRVDPIRKTQTRITQGIAGNATSGSTTTVVDNTKTWTTNQWVGWDVIIYKGSQAGQVARVTANNATTLTFSAMPGAITNTSGYQLGFNISIGMRNFPGDLNYLIVGDEPGNQFGTIPGAVWKVHRTTGVQTVLNSGGFFNHPSDIGIDANGQVLVMNTTNIAGAGKIFRFDPSTTNGTQTSIQTGSQNPTYPNDPGLDGIDADSSGNLYCCAIATAAHPGLVYKIVESTGVTTILSQSEGAQGSDISLGAGLLVYKASSSFTIRVTDTGSSSTNNTNLDNVLRNWVGVGDIVVLDDAMLCDGGTQLPRIDGSTNTNRCSLRSNSIHTASATFPAGIRLTDPRVSNTQQLLMPKITAGGVTAIGGIFWTQLRSADLLPAANWNVQGIEFKMSSVSNLTSGGFPNRVLALVYVGNNGNGGPYSAAFLQDTVAKIPSNITFDRCLMHSGFETPTSQANMQPLGNLLNCHGNNITLTECYLYGCNDLYGNEAHGIFVANCFGPITINNTFVESSTENVFFGGASTNIPNACPDTITITHSHIRKNPAHNPLSPLYDGTRWSVKNLLEFKSGTNITVNDVTFENCWPAVDQQGHAIVVTPRQANSSGFQGNCWTQTANITLTNLHILNSYSGIEVLGCDTNAINGVTFQAVCGTDVQDRAGGAFHSAARGAFLCPLTFNVTMRDCLFENLWDITNYGGFAVNLLCADTLTAGVSSTIHTTLHNNSFTGYTPGASIIGLTPGDGAQFQNGFGPFKVGDVIVLEMPTDSTSQAPGVPDPKAYFVANFDRVTITGVTTTSTSVASGHTFTYGTFTATPAKSHSGNYNVGCSNPEGSEPHWLYLDSGWQPQIVGNRNSLDKVTIDHVTIATSRTDNYGKFITVGGSGAFYNGYRETNVTITNCIFASGSAGFYQALENGQFGGAKFINSGSGYNAVVGNATTGGMLDLATVSIHHNSLYRTTGSSASGGAGYMAASAGADTTSIYYTANNASDVKFTNYAAGGLGFQLLNTSTSYKTASDGTTDRGNRTWGWCTAGDPTACSGGIPPAVTDTTSLALTYNPLKTLLIAPGSDIIKVTASDVTTPATVVTGSVTVSVNGVALGTHSLVNGSAAFGWFVGTPGTYSVVATYAAQAMFAASTVSDSVTWKPAASGGGGTGGPNGSPTGSPSGSQGGSSGAGQAQFYSDNPHPVLNPSETSNVLTGLGCYTSMYGQVIAYSAPSGGPATLDVWVQTSIDLGNSWLDLAHTQLSATSTSSYFQLLGDDEQTNGLSQGDATAVGEVSQSNSFGDQMRIKTLYTANGAVGNFSIGAFAVLKNRGVGDS